MVIKLLESNHLDGSKFVAGKLCETEEQWNYYSKTLDAGPMVSRWINTKYEIPFDMLPDTNLSAHNNKSIMVSIEFAR